MLLPPCYPSGLFPRSQSCALLIFRAHEGEGVLGNKITTEFLEFTTVPKGQRLELMDPKCRGLQIRISEGAKSFAFVHRPKGGKPTRITLGHFPDLTLAAA